MSWLIGDWQHLGAVVGKVALMYATAVIGLRLAERRTLAQWTIIDFVAAVAVGAIVGRTAVAGTQSLLSGAVALIALVAAHRLLSLLRLRPAVGKLLDHRVRVLVGHGQVDRSQLRVCGLTDDDLFAQLRERGVFDLGAVRYVLYEAKGGITVVPEDPSERDREPPLVQAALKAAAHPLPE